MAKQKPLVISGPSPTIEEVRQEYGVTKKEQEQIDKILDKIYKKEKQQKVKERKKLRRLKKERLAREYWPC